MFPHVFEVGHVLWQQKGLLYSISYVPSHAYLKVPNGASHGRGAPFSSKGGAQAEVATWCSPLLFVSWADLVCMPLGYLNPLWGSTYWEEWVFPGSIASLPLSSLFLLWSIGSARVCWVGGGVGSRVWF